VILLAAAVGWNMANEPGGVSVPGPPAAPVAASTPASLSAPTRARAAASLGRVGAASARNDTRSARRILGSIDPAVLKADSGLALRARILRHRIRLTESYLAATAVAEAGRYGEARESTLALVPFRDAGVRARLYGVEIAKGLVAQARSEYLSRPARALALLDRAEQISPPLSAIRTVRAEVTGR
jgi:hypothetical protein